MQRVGVGRFFASNYLPKNALSPRGRMINGHVVSPELVILPGAWGFTLRSRFLPEASKVPGVERVKLADKFVALKEL